MSQIKRAVLGKCGFHMIPFASNSPGINRDQPDQTMIRLRCKHGFT